MGKKEDELYRNIMSQLMPFINQNNARSAELYNAGVATTNFAENEIKGLLDFYKNLQTGEDRTKLLDFVGADQITDEYNNMERVIAELAPRGGRRASELGNLDFARMDNISDLLFGVRAKAPEARAALVQALASIGTTKLGGSSDQNSAILGAFNLGTEQYQRAQDRRTSTINSILGALGSGLGAAAALCFTPDTIVETIDGETIADNINTESKIICFDTNTRNRIEGKVINVNRGFKQQLFKIITNSGFVVNFTPSHFVKTDFDDSLGTSIDDLNIGDSILVIDNNDVIVDKVIKKFPIQPANVINFKLVDEKNNYIFSTNGILSFDNDIKESK